MSKQKRPQKEWGSLEEVERMARQEKDARLSVRLHAIRLLMAGRGTREVAQVFNVGEKTVRNWRSRWDQAGREGLKGLQAGAIPQITPEMKVEIEGVIEIEREINGRTVTAKLIHGHLKKNTT